MEGCWTFNGKTWTRIREQRRECYFLVEKTFCRLVATKFSSLSCFIRTDCWRWPSHSSGIEQTDRKVKLKSIHQNHHKCAALTHHKWIPKAAFSTERWRLRNDAIGHVVVVIESVRKAVCVDWRSKSVEWRRWLSNSPILMRLLLRSRLEWIFERIYRSC